MPNWSSNCLKVTGPKKDLDAFKATLNTKNGDGEVVPFSYAQTVPPPVNMFRGSLGADEKADCKAKGIPNWYDWQSENWGVKWDCSDADVNINPKSVEVHFDSPWAPPLAWLAKASKAHPKLKFHMAYCEGGMGFYGEAIAKAGEVADECNDFPGDVYDDDGEMIKGTVIHKFTEKWAIGTGG